MLTTSSLQKMIQTRTCPILEVRVSERLHFSLSVFALSSPRMQVEMLLHAASLSSRLVRESLLEVSKKRFSYVGQSQSSILCHWRSCPAASVHMVAVLIPRQEMESA